MPIKAKNEVIGLLVVVRKREKSFERVDQSLLEAVGDYASISLVNSRLFRALKQTADASRAGEKRQNDILKGLQDSLQEELKAAIFSIDLLMDGKVGKLDGKQKQALKSAQDALQRLALAAEKTISPNNAVIKNKPE